MSASIRTFLALAPAVVVAAMLCAPAVALAAEAGARKAAHPAARISMRQSDDGQDRDVRIHNQTGWTMTHLYASAGGAWGGDLLGSGALSPGRSLVVTIDDGSGACLFALRAEFDNGEALDRSDVNACQIADYYFTR